jgi:hypothetical protein
MELFYAAPLLIQQMIKILVVLLFAVGVILLVDFGTRDDQ